MKLYHWFVILNTTCLFPFLFCSDIPNEPEIIEHRIQIIDTTPVADYYLWFDVTGTRYDFAYPYTSVQFISTSYDRGYGIIEYGWMINRVSYSGKYITDSFETPGQYEIIHFVKDNRDRVSTKNGYVRVNDYPRVLVRLQYLDFSANVGDGTNETGEVYVVAHSISTDRSGFNPQLQQTILPGSPDVTEPWSMKAYSRNTFGPNSGLILFEGKVYDLLGLSLVVIDHDERGFDWAGLFKNIFSAAATIVSLWEPTSGAVLEGLSGISSIVGEFIEAPQDDVIASFENLFTPNQRWGIGNLHEYTQNGVTIGYYIEVIP